MSANSEQSIKDVCARQFGFFSPPPSLVLSEWADKYAYLSPESAATPGKWNTIPYQKGIMDAMSSGIETTILKSARVGYTKMIVNYIGMCMHINPAPILVVVPTVEDAQNFSKTEIDPMLRDTPVLSQIVGVNSANGRRGKGDTILKKLFSGGSVTIVGAHSGRGFRALSIKYLLRDEIDAWAVTAGKDGDQMALSEKRTIAYHDRAIINGSTPLIKGQSRIESKYNASSQESYHVPCPHCNEKQPLIWGRFNWTKGKPETAVYACINGCVIQHHDKPKMINQGEWIAKHPERLAAHRGFYIWAAYSSHPNATWAHIVAEYEAATDNPLAMIAFINTTVGKPAAHDLGESLDKVKRNFIDYKGFDVPKDVLILTAGVDVQGDRFEIQVIGWDKELRGYGIDYQRIYQDPNNDNSFNALDDLLLKKTYLHELGHSMNIRGVGVDTSYNTQRMYSYCKERYGNFIYAIKGRAGLGIPFVQVSSTRRRSKLTPWLFIVGVDDGKNTLYRNVTKKHAANGALIYPKNDTRFDDLYFEQRTAEKWEYKQVKGKPVRVYYLPSGKQNEALDTLVYAAAAREIINPVWIALEQKQKTDVTNRIKNPETPPAKPRRNRKRRRKSIASNWF